MSRPFPHIAIRASAGSGKTYQLTNRYIRLLLDGESPDRILATTFTRKAAGEIVDRVLTRLAEAVLDAEACSVLAKAVGKPELTSAQVGAALLSTTSVLHRVNISTIDAFFAGIAKAFSLELGFPPQWDIVETSVDDSMRLEAVNATLDGELEAVVTLIRLLGRSEFDRSVASQVSDTVRGLHGVYLDAPDSAWHCLTPRTDPDLIWIEEILRQLEDSAGATGDQNGRMAQALYRNIEDARHGRWKDLIWTGPAKKVLEGSNAYWKQEIPQEIEDLLAALIEQVRAILLKSLIDRGVATHKLLATFDEHLRELKHARAALRFEDVTRALSTAALLGELDDVFFRLDGRIQHLLLDEFQDTSLAQWRVLRPLSQEVASHATGDRSVFLVGDVKQAIYGWRGGVADIFDTLDGDLPGLEWKPLDCSWRSALTIIKTVNYAFEGLQGNKALQDEQAAARQWQQGFKKHKTAKTELPGYARLEVAPQPGDGEHGRDAVFRRAAAIAAELAGQCRGASIGILTRRNDAVRRMIHELRKLGVAASEEGGNPVTDSAAVTLILSLMRLADHPGDSVARFHVASSPLGESLQLDNNAPSAARVSARLRRELVRDGYGACVLRWSEILAPSCDAREARRLGQLVRLAHRHDAAQTLRADDFIAFVESERVEDPATTDVRVMTIHKAKGLEFDIVVLPELEQRLIGQTPAVLVDSPSPTSPPTKFVPYANEAERTAIVELDDMAKKWRAGQIRESLSLLYVALTRAVHALYIVIEPRETKGKYPSTFSGLLRSSLAQGAEAVAEKVLFDLGDENWFKTLSWTKPTSEPAAPLIDRIGMKPSRKRSRGLPRTSPSAMEGGATLQLADLMRLDTGALRRGSIVHALFEQIEWLDDGMPDLKVLRAAARAAGASQEQIATYEEDFQRMLANPDVRRVLTRASYAQPELTVRVYRELPFALRDDKSLITGAMDRVVVRKYGEAVHDVEVLDYKTDGVDEQTLSAKVEHYQPQLDAYRKAAAQVFGVAETQVGAQLVFVNAGYVVDVK